MNCNSLNNRSIFLGALIVLSTCVHAQAQFNCFGLPDTDPGVCSGHGVCIADNSCQCEVGYSGQQCETTSCSGLPGTDPAVCSGHGVCVALDTCSCDVTHVGDDCEFLASEIPTTSSWGVVTLALFVTAAGTVIVRRASRMTSSA